MLQLKNINKSYQVKEGVAQCVLKDLNLTLADSGFVSILGSSGNGKTTLVNIIAGLDDWDSGQIYYNQTAIDDYDAFRREKVGIVFQDANLIGHLSAVDNVIVSMSDQTPAKRASAIGILTDLGLAACIDKLPSQLSGGQQQRVAIARMIAKDVDIVICDEPTGSLDEATGLKIAQIIKALAAEKLVLFVTHDIQLAEAYSDRILKIKGGVIVEDTATALAAVDGRPAAPKSYRRASIWLAFKNLMGRYRHTAKYVLLASFIMLIAAMATILQAEFFKRYMHEDWVDKGLKNAVLDLDGEFDDDDLLRDLARAEQVDYAAYLYGKKIEIATADGSLTTRETAFENIAGNQYFRDILTDGRFPEESDEVLMSAWGAISLLRDLGIGGDRLYDQYMTGGVSSAYVYDLIDRKKFIISEYGSPRIKIVGLVDDDKVYETSHIIYHIDGFTALFEWPFSYWRNGVKLYKTGLYRDAHDEVLSGAVQRQGLTVNSNYQTKIDNLYSRIDSIIALSKVTLSVVLVLASVSLISLLLTALFERKYEIGLYRSIGYSRSDIMKILGLEMLIIGLAAVLIVLICLMIFAFIMYTKLDYIANFVDVLRAFNPFDIAIKLASIVACLVLLVTYGGHKILLRKSILANINDL